MKLLALLLLLWPITSAANDLTRVDKPELATVLGLLQELPAPNTQPGNDIACPKNP